MKIEIISRSRIFKVAKESSHKTQVRFSMKSLSPLVLSRIVASTAIVVALLGSAQAATPQSDRVDEFIGAAYRENNILPNAPIDDNIFVRRIYLDIAGRIPTPQESGQFLSDKHPEKRDRLIDRLLNSEGHVSHSYNYWADILRINNRLQQSGNDAEFAYRHWLKDSIRENKPYDQLVRELVSARGYIWENGAVGYYQRDRGMALDNMSNTVRVFLGTRLECAQCHDHPFDKWTQMDYFQMAAFSNGMDARSYGGDNRAMIGKITSDARYEAVEKATGIKKFPVQRDAGRLKRYLADKGFQRRIDQLGIKDRNEFIKLNKKAKDAWAEAEVARRKFGRVTSDIYNPIQYTMVSAKDKELKLPHDYQYDDADPHEVVTPETMFGLEIDVEKLTDPESTIDVYAEWMTSKDNPTFTRVIVNRLWKKVYGVGLIEPVDELTENSIASHPQLLAHLEDRLKEINYDMRAFLADLYKTETYQRQAFGGEILGGMPYYFPGPKLRRMSAEQIWDSLAALSIPGVDQYQPTFASQLERIERARQIHVSLEGREPNEFRSMMKKVYKIAGDRYGRMDELRSLVYKAKADEKPQLVKKYSEELRKLTSDTRQEITAIAHDKVQKKIDGNSLIASTGMQAMATAGEGMSDTMMGGSSNVVVTSLPPLPKVEEPEGLNKNQRRKWSKSVSTKQKQWRSITKGLMRASEMQSPAPRGHFLREFGQSDRETIENANTEASVPQALNLLNSQTVEILANPFSILGQTLMAAETSEERVAAIFRAMLTREPTDSEVARLAPMLDDNPNVGSRDIIWIILNTQQMIFVQ